ncbi:MAG: DUF1732 domain-containing protein, partial [Firmicutes bacterium]|nr:DUF1732 domain-containing protein [Bacillota bacterium]
IKSEIEKIREQVQNIE